MIEAIAMSDKRNRNISITVTELVRSELEKLAAKEDRSLSWVAGALMNRGLEAFRKDHQLKQPKEAKPDAVVHRDRSRRPPDDRKEPRANNNSKSP